MMANQRACKVFHSESHLQMWSILRNEQKPSWSCLVIQRKSVLMPELGFCWKGGSIVDCCPGNSRFVFPILQVRIAAKGLCFCFHWHAAQVQCSSTCMSVLTSIAALVFPSRRDSAQNWLLGCQKPDKTDRKRSNLLPNLFYLLRARTRVWVAHLNFCLPKRPSFFNWEKIEGIWWRKKHCQLITLHAVLLSPNLGIMNHESCNWQSNSQKLFLFTFYFNLVFKNNLFTPVSCKEFVRRRKIVFRIDDFWSCTSNVVQNCQM